PQSALDIHNLETRLEAFDDVAPLRGPILMCDESGKPEIRDRVCNETEIQLLRIVDLLTAGDAGNMDVADAVDVFPQSAGDVAVGDLNVIDVEEDLYAR